jgi:hypothetical protein
MATESDRVRQYLQQISPQARRNLLIEVERMQMYGESMPGADILLAELRAEFRGSGEQHNRLGNPSRHFFQPIESLFVNRPSERTNPGQISRGLLSPMWEWISHGLLPTMTRDYCESMRQLLVKGDVPKARLVAFDFQAKVLKSLEGTLNTADGVRRARDGLAQYTASQAAFNDLRKVMAALRVREALTKFGDALPTKIDELEGDIFAKVKGLLDAFAAQHGGTMPFALTMIAKRLRCEWQLIYFATKGARSRNAAFVATTRYAISVAMVLDSLDDKRVALKQAMTSDHLQIARETIAAIYEIESALRDQIAQLETLEWGRRLDSLMAQVAADLEVEFHRLPEGIRHVLGSRKLQPQHSALGAMMRRSRDALSNGAAYCRNLVRE